MHRQVRSVALSDTGDLSDHSVGLEVEGTNLVLADGSGIGLVDETEHGDDRGVLGLNHELGEGSDNVQRSLSVGKTHDTAHPVDRTQSTRVIPTVLRTWDGVEIEVDSDSVFPCPADSSEDISPGDSLEVWLLARSCDGPVTNRQTDPVETGRDNLDKVTLSDESLVVLRHGGGEVVAHVLRKGVLVDSSLAVGASGVSFVETGNNERLSVEPSTEVDTVDLVDTPCPILVQGWRPGLSLSFVLERDGQLCDPVRLNAADSR